MGDRCYLEITMRKADLPRFAPFAGARADEKWWDNEDDVDRHPDLVTVGVYEANYAWSDQRLAAAKAGVPFYGNHGEGGEYGPYAFAALDSEMLEVEVNGAGYMFIAVDDNLQPVDHDDLKHMREYVAKLRAVKRLFGMEENHNDGAGTKEEDTRPDQSQSDPGVLAGVCAA
jgi:hypothetical protein